MGGDVTTIISGWTGTTGGDVTTTILGVTGVGGGGTTISLGDGGDVITITTGSCGADVM
jgi:hypothetical protein